MAKHLSTHAVERVAGYIAEVGLEATTDEGAMAELRRINESDEGWTIDTSAPLGGIVRHEGVRLSDADLRAALILGTSWLAGEDTHTGYAGMMTVTEARERAQAFAQ